MRLNEVERGDTLRARALIGAISLASGMRLPDAARVAFYHKDFVSAALGAWTQKTMRGESAWSVGQRELMAALVAKWNACAFCIGAHRAVAVEGLSRETVDAVLADFETAAIDEGFRATLRFLHVMTTRPNDLGGEDARRVLSSGVSRAALADAVAVGTLFAIVTRYADALKFTIPSEAEFAKAARMLLERGYQ
ncbi:MAG TPA: hypothetical protein VGH28_27635 [Polyangiaceae bacterium]|jgi:uncharacterized peroxidase-related enzyme